MILPQSLRSWCGEQCSHHGIPVMTSYDKSYRTKKGQLKVGNCSDIQDNSKRSEAPDVYSLRRQFLSQFQSIIFIEFAEMTTGTAHGEGTHSTTNQSSLDSLLQKLLPAISPCKFYTKSHSQCSSSFKETARCFLRLTVPTHRYWVSLLFFFCEIWCCPILDICT